MTAEAFFKFARERHAIALRRARGQPRPWTEDYILDTYRFTNVFREMDRTTVWIRENVRDARPDEDAEQQILRMVLARTLNRTETLEQIFCQHMLFGNSPPAWRYLDGDIEIDDLEAIMRNVCARPWVTGAYIVKTPDGMDKLRGALWIVQQAAEHLRAAATNGTLESALGTMQTLHSLLTNFPYLGGFTAYEIVTDLRHMSVGREWPDIMTWANAGPGATRGLNYIHGRDPKKTVRQSQLCSEMRELVTLSQDPQYWPQDWLAWEMRDAEHTCCEYLKYARYASGGVPPKTRFK